MQTVDRGGGDTTARDATVGMPEAQEALEISAIHLLHRASQYAGEVFNEEVRSAGLTPRQYAILLTVSQHEGLSQTDLVSRTGIDRSTLADVVRRMLRKGLVTRRRTRQDARAYSVRTTAEGREALAAAGPSVEQADRRFLNSVPPEHRECFVRSLHTLVNDS